MGVGAFAYSDGRVEVGRYRGDSGVGDVVCWSADRQQAWRLTEEGEQELINLELALALGRRLAWRMPALALFSSVGVVGLRRAAGRGAQPGKATP